MDDDTRAQCYECMGVCVLREVTLCSSGGGGEKRRGTSGRTLLRHVTLSLLFLWPIYRLLLLALYYYCYQVLFTPPTITTAAQLLLPSPFSPNRLQCRAFYCSPTMWNIPLTVFSRTTLVVIPIYHCRCTVPVPPGFIVIHTICMQGFINFSLLRAHIKRGMGLLLIHTFDLYRFISMVIMVVILHGIF